MWSELGVFLIISEVVISGESLCHSGHARDLRWMISESQARTDVLSYRRLFSINQEAFDAALRDAAATPSSAWVTPASKPIRLLSPRLCLNLVLASSISPVMAAISPKLHSATAHAVSHSSVLSSPVTLDPVECACRAHDFALASRAARVGRG